jgi:hypothetical protein
MVSSGIAAIDTLAGGLPRGCLTEICGPASSGRTTLLLAALAAATRRGEFCVVVDASDALDPYSVAAAGIDLGRLLWVRCGENSPQKSRNTKNVASTTPVSKPTEPRAYEQRSEHRFEHRLEQVLRATDMLLESGGFGLIALDLTDLPPQTARRIPLTTWFRFRRAVEHTPTVLLSVEQQPIAGSCSSLLLKLEGTGKVLSESVVQENNLQERNSQYSNSLTVGNPIDNSDAPAAKRRKYAAHGASRGSEAEEEQAPEGRKKINLNEQTDLYFSNPNRDFSYPAHAQLLTGLEITAELLRSRLERKPVRAASMAFTSKTAWAG